MNQELARLLGFDNEYQAIAELKQVSYEDRLHPDCVAAYRANREGRKRSASFNETYEARLWRRGYQNTVDFEVHAADVPAPSIERVKGKPGPSFGILLYKSTDTKNDAANANGKTESSRK